MASGTRDSQRRPLLRVGRILASRTTAEAVRGVGWASADSRWGSVKGTRCCASGPVTSWTLASADPVDLPAPRCSLTILVLVTVLLANANRSLACSGKNQMVGEI